MIGKRTIINVLVFLIASTGLILFGFSNFVLQQREGLRLTADFSTVSGLSPRNDITMRGVTVGAVTDVDLTETGVRIEMTLEPGAEVPRLTQATIVRRSPIGDLVVELTPGHGEPLESGANISAAFTKPPPDAGETIEVLADVLHSVPSEDLHTLVSELAKAVEGRGTDLARLSEVTADLPERILQVSDELESLIRTGPRVTGVLARKADVLADDIALTAELLDILRDRRFDLVALYRSGASFTEVAGGLIEEEKANLSCLIADFGSINSELALARNLTNLIGTLELNHFFFDGLNQLVQPGLDGRNWFRVQLLPHTEPPADIYEQHLRAPDVFAGNACHSRYGNGVGPGSQDHKVRVLRGSDVHRGR